MILAKDLFGLENLAFQHFFPSFCSLTAFFEKYSKIFSGNFRPPNVLFTLLSNPETSQERPFCTFFEENSKKTFELFGVLKFVLTFAVHLRMWRNW